MGLSAPPFLNGFLDAGTIARNAQQQQQDGKVTPAAAALNAKVQQLPAYQRYMQAKTSHVAGSDMAAGQQFAAAVANLDVPDDVIFDPYTGQFREKNWSERNSNWSALLYAGAAVGAGLGAGAALGAFGAGDAAAGAAGGAGSGAAGSAAPELGAAWEGAGAAGEAGAAGTAGGAASSAYGPLAGGYGAATTSAEVPTSLAGVGGGAGGGAGLGWGTLLKYGIPAVAGGVDAYLGQQNADANRGLAQEQIALNQSNLDPFRATMAQTRDVGKLERAANPPQTMGVAPGSRYAGAVNSTTGGYRGYTPSSTYLNTVRNAQQQVATGQGQAPNMMDQANWGKSGVSDLTAPTTAAPGSTLAQPPLQAPGGATDSRISKGGSPSFDERISGGYLGDQSIDPNDPRNFLMRYRGWRPQPADDTGLFQ